MGNSMNKLVKSKPNESRKSSGAGPQPSVKDAMNKGQEQVHQPGEGIRSMKTSGVFRAVNFELYAKPNKPTMIIGSVAIIICAGYIVYMNLKYDRSKYYSAETEDGSLILRPKKSRWET